MKDGNTADLTASLLTRNLHEVFGERDDARRAAAIQSLFTADCIFTDPDGEHHGREAVVRAIRSLLLKRAGFVFSETTRPQRAGDAGLLGWGFGPPGESPHVTVHDMILVRSHCIAALYTFIDP